MKRFLLVGLVASACGPSGPKEGECKDNLRAGDLVITEVFADFKAPVGGGGTDEGKEWFEIYNATEREVELEGMVIAHGRPDDAEPKLHTMEKITIAPGQYLTLGNSTMELLPPYIDYGYSADLDQFFNSDGGKLELRCGDTVIDAAEYQNVDEGHSRQLTSAQAPDYTLNDDQTMWCDGAGTMFEENNFGTPGTENDCRPTVVGQCEDGGTMRDTVPPAEGTLVITEFLANPPGTGTDDTQEWFEIQNTGSAAFDLNGLGVKGNTATIDMLESDQCITIAPGAFAVLAHDDDMAVNGGLPRVDALFDFALAASNGSIEVLNNGTSLDRITWTTGISEGVSKQLDPDLATTTGNDEPSNFCNGTASYGTVGALGTPGVANGECTLIPPAGMCSDGGSNRPVVKPAVGALVINEFLANPLGTGTDGTQEWFEITNTGATAFDLNDLIVKGNSTMSTVTSSDCKSVPPGGFALFAHVTEPEMNGGLPLVDATFTTALAQSNGSLSILDGATVIDAITWTTGIVEGASKQLDPTKTTATDNDTPANFCNATATQTYGTAGNLGTPKAVNACL